MPSICGILFSPLPNLKRHLGKLLHILHPEDSKHLSDWSNEQASFGMGGGKIWSSDDFVILFDGQIPIESLNGKSDPFESQLIESYKEMGDAFIEKLPGSFALALFDIKNQELSLYRDRLGQKPIYWIYTSEGFVFSSKLKGIIASNLLALSLDVEAISDYLVFGYTPLEKTVVQDVFKLMPGHYLKIKKESQHRIRPYWKLGSKMLEKNDLWTFSAYENLASSALKEIEESQKSPYFVYSHENELELIKKFFPESGIPPIKTLLKDSFFSKEAIENAFEKLPETICQLDEPVGHLYSFSSSMLFNGLKEKGYGSIIFPIGSLPWIERHFQKPELKRARWEKSLAFFLKLMIRTPLTRKMLPLKIFRSLKIEPWDVAILKELYWTEKDLVKELIKPPLQLIDEEIFLHYFPSLEKISHTLSSPFYLLYKVALPQLYLHTIECYSTALNIQVSLPFLNDKVAKYLLSIPDTRIGNKSETSLTNLFTQKNEKCPVQESLWKILANASHFEKHKHYIFEGMLLESGLLSKNRLESMWKRKEEKPFFQSLWSMLQLEMWLFHFFEKRL